ncbi:hypothetical protein Tco_1045370 [Tanacetum coccineum]|uniref:Polyphenol oxidase C-terminal domain-containing protein n=1 Tax=Tanacetum coccineum TaxID=301880 RepID=A0ABQ5GTN5_9ASTR
MKNTVKTVWIYDIAQITNTHLKLRKKKRWIEKPPPNLVELLVQSNLYDMVFTNTLEEQSNNKKFVKFDAFVNDKVDINGTLPKACDPEFEGSFAHVPHSDNQQGGMLMMCNQEAILEQEQAVEEKQELLAEEQAANPSEPSPVSYFYNADHDNISTLSTTYTIHLTKRLFLDELKELQQNLERTLDAITPDFPITDSLSMGDEHLSTIPKTESNELIKSSVENLVPTPSESEDLSKGLTDMNDDKSFSDFKIFSNPLSDEEIISTKIDPHHFNAESDLIEFLALIETPLIISSPQFILFSEEFLRLKLAHIDLILHQN